MIAFNGILALQLGATYLCNYEDPIYLFSLAEVLFGEIIVVKITVIHCVIL